MNWIRADLSADHLIEINNQVNPTKVFSRRRVLSAAMFLPVAAAAQPCLASATPIPYPSTYGVQW